MKVSRIGSLVLLAVCLFGAGVWSGVLIDRARTSPASGDSSSALRVFDQAWDTTRRVYVDRAATQPQALAYGAISGMVDSLGDTGHSRFLTPDEVRQENDFQQGQIEGVGIEVQQKEGHVVIVAPLEGTPAQKAGLRPGDIILAVDGQQVTDINDAVHRILGPAGTSVTLTIMTTSGATKDVPLVRARIDVKTVTWHILPGTKVAHIRLSSFSKGAADGLASAISDSRNEGATSIVLDLRDNPGGLLDEAIRTASLFLKSGNVLLEKDANGNTKPDPVQSDAFLTDDPVVVLISNGTASASEIVAGALQDAGRAKLVGETTFGTGTVLQQYSLSDGSALLLAVQEWLTPSGRTIWHKGLPPDMAVPLATDAIVLYPDAETGMTPADLAKSSDAQLLKAISVLNGQ